MNNREPSSYQPLPLVIWKPQEVGGESAYMAAYSRVNEEVLRLPEGRLREMGQISLFRSIAVQGDRNDKVNTLGYLDNQTIDQDLLERAKWGGAEPDELINVLHQLPHLEAIEIARHTHVGRWDTAKELDVPVAAALLKPHLGTQLTADMPRFKLKSNIEDLSAQVIERKQRIAFHLGRSIATIRRINVMVDMEHPEVDSELVNKILNTIEDHRQSTNSKAVDHEAHAPRVAQVLQPYLDLPVDLRPVWLQPLVTTYYSKIETDQ
jgi:hypothetical protein